MNVVHALSPKQIESLVACATSAPSVLNTQPWRFEASDDWLDLHIDRDRLLLITDPNGRAGHISCGAALFNLRLGLAHLGFRPGVDLFPRPEDETHLARVWANRSGADPDESARLYQQIPRRRSSRLPFSDQLVPAAVLNLLRESAAKEGAFLHFLTGWARADLVNVIHEADRIQRNDAEAVTEIRSWINRPGSERDGVPLAALGPRPRDPKAVVRDFDMATPRMVRDTADFEAAPTLAVLHSRTDTETDWMHTGQALQRVLLTASANGLSSSMSTQAAEIPELRWLLRDSDLGVCVPHAVLRLGFGPRGAASPRRPISEVLTIVDH